MNLAARANITAAGRPRTVSLYRDLTHPHRHFWQLTPADRTPPRITEYWRVRDEYRKRLDEWAAEHDREIS